MDCIHNAVDVRDAVDIDDDDDAVDHSCECPLVSIES